MHGQTNTEQYLLQQLAAGEHKATHAIYKQYHNIVRSWIIKSGGNTDEAADIFQEAIVVLYEKAQNDDFRLTCKIGTYLFAVSKHLWYKKLQSMQKLPAALPHNAGTDEDMDWAYEEDVNVHQEREAHFEQLNGALDQLGEPCRSLIKAFYHYDKSMQEIAADFGYTNPDNAKTQKYKCLARLRRLFYGVQAK